MTLRRVVIVYDFGSVNGGAAQVAINSALGLAARGVRVDYFCAVGPTTALENSGIAVHCLQQADVLSDPSRLRAASRGLWNDSAARALRALLASCDPQETVVHVHGWTKALSASIFPVIEASGLPLITTLHEFFSVCPNGGFFDYQRSEICTRTPLSLDCITTHCDARSYPQKLWRVTRQALTKNVAHVPARLRDVIYISQLSRQVLEPHFSPSTRWHFVRNPVDVAACERARPEAQRKFLFVGRLSPEKGAALFAEAASLARVPACIVGDGELRESISQRWPEVELLGWRKPHEVMRELRQSRALVFPSLWYETQGLVVQEALANGIPVLVADRSAAIEAVRDGYNGLLFKHGDLGSLVAALSRLRDEAELSSMSEQAHATYWLDPATTEAHVERLLEIYGLRIQSRCGLV